MAEKVRGVLDILEPSSAPGPKQGLGGWGHPASNSAVGAGSLGLILGYCLEKVTNQFAFLRSLTVKGTELQKSLRQATISKPGASINIDNNPHRKKAVATFNSVKQELSLGQSQGLHELVMTENLLHALKSAEKEELLSLVLHHKDHQTVALQQAALCVLRNADNEQEFSKLLQAGGGKGAFLSRLHGHHLGAFYALLEHFGVESWVPPFYHGIFTGEVAGESPVGNDPLASLRQQLVPGTDPIIRDEYVDRFVQGDLTASDMMGLTREELYMIAQRGYDLLQEGKLKDARDVFDGLVYLDPYDPYFYTVLGSVCQRQENDDDAIRCYNIAIRLQAWNINALANRGEILLNQGKMTDALRDLQAVIAYDPDQENKNPSVVRTKALLFTIKELIDLKAGSQPS